MRKILFLLLCSIFYVPTIAKPYLIKIATQDDFDRLDSKIETAYNSGSNDIVVTLKHNVYTYKESHLTMKYATRSLSVTILGNGSILRGKNHLTLGDLNPNYTYFKGDKLYNSWSDVVQTTSLADVADGEKKICRIQKIKGIEVSPDDYIQISQWYLSPWYLVKFVDNEYIYFEASDLSFSDSFKDWNINMDYGYGKELPRYRVFRSNSKECLESDVACFIALDNLQLKSFELRDLNFEGCSYSSWKGLVRFNGVESNVLRIKGCTFVGSKSVCVNMCITKNIIVENCHFEKNYSYCIRDDQKCQDVKIRNNRFVDNNCGWKNQFNIMFKGSNFVISGNTFADFGYGAIGVGVWYAAEKDKSCKVTGVIENNEIFYSPSYFANYMQHTLMDGGAIYTFTKNDDVTIRYNYIHDFIGMKDNRGIFCDDGTCNVKIYGNIITNTPNCYSIDLREVARVEEDPRYDFGKANVGNEIYGNIVDGRVRFEGRNNDVNNACVYGGNYVLASGEDLPAFKLSSVQKYGDDVTLNCMSADGKVTLDKQSFKLFKKHPYYKQLKRWVKKGR